MPISASPTLPVKKIPVHIKNSQNRVLIKGGRVVNHDQTFYADLYIEDGLIKDVGENLIVPGGVKTIEAKGKLVIPGGIDAHAHLDFLFMGTRTVDDFYSGTKSALAGGCTTVMSYVNELYQNRQMSLIEAFNMNKEKADAKACTDFSFHVVLNRFDDKVSKEIEAMVHEKGINSFVIYTSFKDLLMLKENELIRAVRKCKELGAVAMIHAENGEMIEECESRVKSEYGISGPEGHLLSRPEQLEQEAVQRVISIAEELNCPLFLVNVMSKSSALAISDARRRGVVVFGESLAVSLGTDGTHYFNKCWRHAAGHVVSPPLRDDPTTPSFLMDLLSNGDLEVCSSAHCTFNTNQKALGKDDFTKIPPGCNGIEERMSLVWDRGVRTGKMDACRFVAVTSTNAAKLFNMYPRKGRIERGSDADVVVFDPEASKTINVKSQSSVCDFNVFEGMTLYGVPSVVISSGRIVLEDGQLTVCQGLNFEFICKLFVRVKKQRLSFNEAVFLDDSYQKKQKLVFFKIKGTGKFVERPCFSEYAYGRIKVRDNLKPRKVEREAYTGEVVDISKEIDCSMLNLKLANSPNNPNILHRPLTKAGARNLQDSSFSIGGDFDEQSQRSTRAKMPPGGKSSLVF
jgi:D-hydantoinase